MQQHQQWGSGGGGSGGGGARGRGQWRRHAQPLPQLCLHWLRGSCRFGAGCRYSHDVSGYQAAAGLPFHHREPVQAQANVSAAAAAADAAAASGAPAPWRFRVLSYNILADHLAHEHAAELYTSAPRFSLEWGYRRGLIVREILHHRPDVVALQEVDHFRQMQQALQAHGYEGIYTQRTGSRRDGLALFWRTDAVRPVKQRIIQFSCMGLKDNVAQLVAFRRRLGADDTSSRTSSEGSVGSLTGRKRRQAQQGGASSSGASGGRHIRFASDSEGEGEQAPVQPAVPESSEALAAAAVEAVRIDERPPAGGASGSGWMGQVPVEEATQPADADEEAAGQGPSAWAQAPHLVVANIHVLFNPKRGDMKMGQVRTLLEHVDSLCLQQQKRTGQRAAAVVCGDFNSAAGSPIYEFVCRGALDLTQHDRRRMSGQVEASGHNWRALQQAFLERQERERMHMQQLDAEDVWPGDPSPMGVGASMAALAGRMQQQVDQQQQQQQEQQIAVTPYAIPLGQASHGSGGSRGRSSEKTLRPWSADDVRMAAGAASGGPGEPPTARHPLHLESAYRAVTGAEATFSTCHDKFIGCVDFQWYEGGEGAPWRLLPLAVLPPPPLETLSSALPSPAWPSDHISLVCDYALVPSAAEPQQERGQRGKRSHL